MSSYIVNEIEKKKIIKFRRLEQLMITRLIWICFGEKSRISIMKK